MMAQEGDYIEFAQKVVEADLSNVCGKIVNLLIDSGASELCSPEIDDFENFRSIDDPNRVVGGIAKGLSIKGKGKLRYVVKAKKW